MKVEYPFPLQWPQGWERTLNPDSSRFKPKTIKESTDFVLSEIERLCKDELSPNPIISSDLKLKKDGLPYSSQRTEDNGVAVYFMLDGEQRVIACDAFSSIADNLWSVGKTVEAMRGIERWGCSEILKRTFSGFKALPSGHELPGERKWFDVLECDEFESNPDIVKRAWHKMATQFHPDMGDSANTERFNEATEAWHTFKKLRGIN